MPLNHILTPSLWYRADIRPAKAVHTGSFANLTGQVQKKSLS